MKLNHTPANAGAHRAWLSTKEAAAYLDLQPCTLEKWRCQGKGPRFHRLGTKAIRYRKRDLDAFIEGGANG